MKYYLDNFGDQIDINVQNLSGVTPLHLASYSGHLYIVKFLVEQPKIDIFLKDDNGTLPLAYGANNPQIVEFISHIDGMDINHQNFQGILIVIVLQFFSSFCCKKRKYRSRENFVKV